MVIYFKTKKIQKLCSSSEEAHKKLGAKMAKKLLQRMMELNAAGTLQAISYLPPPRCHELSGDRRGLLSVDLEYPYRLLFIPANKPRPVKNDGGLDWAQVTEIEIIDITDTH